MALARVKSWVSEVLTATDLNAEFNNILNFVNASKIIAVDSLTLATNDMLQYSGTAWANITPTVLFNQIVTGGEGTVASATTTDLSTSKLIKQVVTGTTTITGFGTGANLLRIVRFSGVLTLTYNATSLITKIAANRTTVAGDIGIYTSDGSGNWTEINFFTSLGDFVESIIVDGSAVAATSATDFNITSILLTPGEWDVCGNVVSSPAGTTTTSQLAAGINTASATLPNVDSRCQNATAATAGNRLSAPLSRRRVIIGPGNATVYLVGNVTFAVSTMGLCGYINARRMR